MTRRVFLKGNAAILAGAVLGPGWLRGAARPKPRIGARQFGGNFNSAKLAGMDGLELGVGGAAEKLSIADPAVRQQYKEGAKATGLAITSLSLDLLNQHPLFSDPQAPAWVEQAIDAAKDLGASGMLVPFFGQAELTRGGEMKTEETEALVKRLKRLAPKAEAAGVVLGIETTLSAKQYLDLLDRVGSPAVRAYYDIGNTTYAGLDVSADLRALKGRIFMIHFKDGGSYLGEGKVKLEPIIAALQETGYPGWIVLETACPSKNVEADCRRNAEYIRKLWG